MTETVLLILRGGRYDTFDDYEEIPHCFLLLFCIRRFVNLGFLLHWELGMDKLQIAIGNIARK